MPQTSHRAARRARRRLPARVSAIGVALAVTITAATVVGFASDDRAGDSADEPAPAPAVATAAGTTLVETPSSGTTGATDTPTAESGATTAPETGTSTSTGELTAPTATDTPVATPGEVERVVAERRKGLEERVAEADKLAREVARRIRLANQPFDVRIASFNVLGSQHTGPGGDRKNFAPDALRAQRTAELINSHATEIVGMQELQPDQFNAITARTGMAAYPGYAWGSQETDNSILYDDDRFEFVSGDRFYVTYSGRPRAQPILRLRVRETGREFYVVNTHPAAGASRTGERYRGHAALVGVVSELRATGLPVLITGDMNDREQFYCRVVGPAGLVAANGGGAGCAPPPGPIPVDWVVGTSDVSFDGYVRDVKPTVQRTSDHYYIAATAHVG